MVWSVKVLVISDLVESSGDPVQRNYGQDVHLFVTESLQLDERVTVYRSHLSQSSQLAFGWIYLKSGVERMVRSDTTGNLKTKCPQW